MNFLSRRRLPKLEYRSPTSVRANRWSCSNTLIPAIPTCHVGFEETIEKIGVVGEGFKPSLKGLSDNVPHWVQNPMLRETWKPLKRLGIESTTSLEV